MKTTLTWSDPQGWYLCRNVCAEKSTVLWWDGKLLKKDLSGESESPVGFNEFYRLLPDSKAVSKDDFDTLFAQNQQVIFERNALNEELRTLREELATNKHSLDVCSKYAESMQRYSEDYLGELRKEREENATLQNQADSLLKQAEQLEAELARLKSQPYAIRQANEPDCEGLWRNCYGAIREWHETDLAGSNGFHYGPYHFIGPLPVIPVVVEQQPPKVVTINYQGKNMRAIPSDNPEYWTLLGDNGITCGVAIGKFEEVQP